MKRDPSPARPVLSAFLVACALAVPVAAQEPADAKPPEQDPAIEEKIDALQDAWKDRRQRRDAEATRHLRELGARLGEPIHPKDRKQIGAVFAKVLTAGRLRAPDAIAPYQAAVDGLSKLGEDGFGVLIRIYEKKRFPRHTDWAPMRVELIEAIGRTGSPKAIPFLIERVQRSGEDTELRAAGVAMAGFASARQQDRKDMVEILVGRLAGFEAEASAPPVNQEQQLNLNRENAIRTLRAVAGPWKASLEKLTGQSLESGAVWHRWFRENKRKDWPARSKGD